MRARDVNIGDTINAGKVFDKAASLTEPGKVVIGVHDGNCKLSAIVVDPDDQV